MNEYVDDLAGLFLTFYKVKVFGSMTATAINSYEYCCSLKICAGGIVDQIVNQL